MYRLRWVGYTVNKEIPAVKTGFMTVNSYFFFTDENNQEVICANSSAALRVYI